MSRLHLHPFPFLFAGLALACGDNAPGGAFTDTWTPSPTSVSPSGAPTGTETASGSTGGTAGSDGSTTPPPTSDPTTSGTTEALKLDVGLGDTTAGADGPGCRKLDLLFVIDNTDSMAKEQSKLISAFPSFLYSLKQALPDAQDYHVMIIDSDAWPFAQCEDICVLFNNTCPFVGEGYECGDPPFECEDVLGAGVVHPRGKASSQLDCAFASGKRYMDDSEPDLPPAFACAAQVGTASLDFPERPMHAMVTALADDGPAHDCNVGFLRDDALLVVVFLTDADDDSVESGSWGTPATWKAALVEAKHGDEEAIVVLGLFGDNDQPEAICEPYDEGFNGAEPSPRLSEFVASFGERGVRGSVCAPHYDAYFAEAVESIVPTCAAYEPPEGLR